MDLSEILKQAEALNVALQKNIQEYTDKRALLEHASKVIDESAAALQAKEADLARREEAVRGVESVVNLRREAETMLAEAKQISTLAAESNKKERTEIDDRRRFMNDDINRLEKARADLDTDKQDIKATREALEAEKASYKEKLQEEIMEKFSKL